MADQPFVDQDVSAEEWREYEWTDPATKARTTYRINSPARVVIPRRGASTHRVIDKDGILHVVPAVGAHGCVIRCCGPLIF